MISTEKDMTAFEPLGEFRAALPGDALPKSGCWGSRIREQIKARACLLGQSLLERHPRLQKLLWECHSFRIRIRVAIGSNEPYRVPTGFLWLESPNGDACMNTRSLARSEHIQKVASTVPWATPLDWRTHLQSWEAGVEWAVRNLGSDSSLSDEHKALLSSELSYQGPKQL
jgi:hypothetical protein